MGRADVVGSWRRCHDRDDGCSSGAFEGLSRHDDPHKHGSSGHLAHRCVVHAIGPEPHAQPPRRLRKACRIGAQSLLGDRRLLPAVDRVRRCPELLPTELYLDDGWTCQVSPPGLPFRPPRKHPHRVLPHRVLDGEGHLPTAVAPSDPKEQQRAVHQAGDWRTRMRATTPLIGGERHASFVFMTPCRIGRCSASKAVLGAASSSRRHRRRSLVRPPLATATSSPRPLTTCEPGTHRRVPILEIRPVGNQPTARDPPPHKHIRRRLTLGGRADLLHHQQHRIASTSASRSGGRRSTAIRLPGRGWMASSNPVSTITGLSSDR